jgi:hypothetical protein
MGDTPTGTVMAAAAPALATGNRSVRGA